MALEASSYHAAEHMFGSYQEAKTVESLLRATWLWLLDCEISLYRAV